MSAAARWWEKPPSDSEDDLVPNIVRRVSWADDNTVDYIDHIYQDDDDPFSGNFEKHDSKIKSNDASEEG